MNTHCPSCHTVNRVPDERVQEGAKCGRCGHALFDGEVINATEGTLDLWISGEQPVVVDFWAPWCGPCVNFAPIFEEVAAERQTELRFVKVNTEAEAALSARFRIRSIPTLMVFKNGQLLDMLNGALPKAQFNQWLDAVLSQEK